MSLEKHLKENTEALNANTEAVKLLTEALNQDDRKSDTAVDTSDKETVKKADKEESKPEKAKKKDAPKKKKEKAKSATKEDVRAALVALSQAEGKNAAKDVLADYDAVKMGDVDESDYQSVIDVCNKLLQAEPA